MVDVRITRRKLETEGVRLRTGEAYRLIVIRELRRVRLVGMYFDLNKCFLLPQAMKGIRALRTQYGEHPGCNLLVVGHTDTSGRDAYNLTLSLERADAVSAYLTDGVSAWTRYYDDTVAQEKRWGRRETQLMLSALPEGEPPYYQGACDGSDDAAYRAAVEAFQSREGLEVDGIVGPITREALVRSYMALDGTSLPPGTTLTVHGCGEGFPVEATGDGVRHPENRRVEIFFFDGPITPPPPGPTSAPGSTAYLEWLSHVTETDDFICGEDTQPEAEVRIQLLDAYRAPLVHRPYSLEVAGRTYKKITDHNGMLVETVPASASGGMLLVGDVRMELVFRDLEPRDTPAGAQERLSNLGMMDIDHATGVADDGFQHLLASYQESEGLEGSGQLDPATQDSLEPSAVA